MKRYTICEPVPLSRTVYRTLCLVFLVIAGTFSTATPLEAQDAAWDGLWVGSSPETGEVAAIILDNTVLELVIRSVSLNVGKSTVAGEDLTFGSDYRVSMSKPDGMLANATISGIGKKTNKVQLSNDVGYSDTELGNIRIQYSLYEAAVEGSRDTVRNIQEKLKKRGYYLGRIDGLAGPGTGMAALKCIAHWKCNFESEDTLSIDDFNADDDAVVETPQESQIIQTLETFVSNYALDVENFLDDNFHIIRLSPNRRIEVLSKDDFLSRRYTDVSIKIGSVGKFVGDTIKAKSILNKKSRYLHENVIAVFVFKENQLNKIRSIIEVPLHSSLYPQGGGLISFVQGRDGERLQSKWNSSETIIELDATITELLSSDEKIIEKTGNNYKVFFALSAPTRPNARVLIEQSFRNGGVWLKPYRHKYVVDSYDKFGIISTDVSVKDPKTEKIKTQLFVDGTLVLEDLRQVK